MKVASILFRNGSFEQEKNDENLVLTDADLVLGFGARELVSDETIYNRVTEKFPVSKLVLCSSSGEINGTEVLDDTISFTVIKFSSTVVKSSEVNISDFSNSYEAGKVLMQNIEPEDLKFVLVISDGGFVNGSELVK